MTPLLAEQALLACRTFVDRHVAPSASWWYWLNGSGAGLVLSGPRDFAAVVGAVSFAPDSLERCPAQRAQCLKVVFCRRAIVV